MILFAKTADLDTVHCQYWSMGLQNIEQWLTAPLGRCAERPQMGAEITPSHKSGLIGLDEGKRGQGWNPAIGHSYIRADYHSK